MKSGIASGIYYILINFLICFNLFITLKNFNLFFLYILRSNILHIYYSSSLLFYLDSIQYMANKSMHLPNFCNVLGK